MKRSSARLVGAALVTFALLAPAAAHAVPTAFDQDIRSVEIPGFRILSLSPDGQWLAASAPEALCTFDVASLAERACGDLEGPNVALSEHDVVWAPDSSRLAFTEQSLTLNVDGDLWLMDATTGELTNVTDDGYEGTIAFLDRPPADGRIDVDLAPTWSPDGGAITISRSTMVDEAWTGTEIVNIDPDTGDVEPLTTVSTERFVVHQGMEWAPDRQRLFYSVESFDVPSTEHGVWVFDPSTGRSSQLIGIDPDFGSPAVIEVAATGDVGLIVYPRYVGIRPSDPDDWVMLADLSSGELTPIDPAGGTMDDDVVVRTATFAADGAEVLFATYDQEVGRLLLHGLPEGKAAEVAASIDWAPTIRYPGGGLDWAGDGTVLAADGRDEGIVLHVDPTAN